MADAESLVPPARVLELQAVLIDATCRFLQQRVPALSEQQLRFLCEPWAHFFVHSALHRAELHGQAPAPGHDLAFYGADRAVPGDTLAFFEWFRSQSYRCYLDAKLAGQEGTLNCRTEVYVLGGEASALAATVCFKPCFPRNFKYLLHFYSLGRVGFMPDQPVYVAVRPDWTLRVELAACLRKALALGHPALADWLARCAAELCPKSLLEHLPVNFAAKCHSRARRALYSADAWHIIDDWKVYALAQKTRHQAHWIGAPNALSHGSLAVFWQREFELGVLDRYLTWGWAAPAHTGKEIVPFYSPHLAGCSQAKPVHTADKTGILISAAARPQHLLEYPYTPDRFERYLQTQLALASEAHTLTGQPVAIRTRPRDLGWDVQAMVEALGVPQVTLEFQKGKFSERLAQCRLHICDNCSTTIAESLWANHPTLVLITEDYFQIRPEATADYDALGRAGVLYTHPASLLTQLERLEGSRLEDWWLADATQQAVQRFLARQGRTGSGLGDWKKALLN